MVRKILNCALMISLLAALGCASTEGGRAAQRETDREVLPEQAVKAEAAMPAEETDSRTKVSDDASSAKAEDQGQRQNLTLPEFKKPVAKPKALPKAEPLDLRHVFKTEGNVTLNADNMPLSDFIIYSLGDTLKVTFFMDEQVKNMKSPVTLMMTREMPAESVLEIVAGLLEKHELIIEEKNGALYITKTKIQARKPLDIRFGTEVPDSPAEILQIFPLRHTSAYSMDGFIRDFLKPGINMRVYQKENAIMFSGPASAIREVTDFIELFDVPRMQDKKLYMLKLVYWQVSDFINQLFPILDNLGFMVARAPSDPGTLFIPIQSLNSVLLVAPDESALKYVLDWHQRLDTPESAGKQEMAYFYTPRYSKASDLVESLKHLYVEASPALAKGPSPPPAASVPAPASADRSNIFASNLKVASDDKKNLILIRSTPAEYKSVLTYFERLDVPPKQVLIEATIAELTLKDDLSYGLEWYMKNRMKDGTYTLSTLGKLGVSSGSGIAYQFLADSQNFQVVLNAFAAENKINIISSPRLMVLDNYEASIQIGTDVPTRTGSTTVTTGSATSVESIQYRNTGLVLNVKPTINSEGLLTLSLSIESSDSAKNNVSSIDSPLILTRRIHTLIAAASGQSIMLGGLISENNGETQSKVPLIGDIPLLGNLFKSTSKNITKTELVILITPTIITSTENAARLTSEFKQGLKWFK